MKDKQIAQLIENMDKQIGLISPIALTLDTYNGLIKMEYSEAESLELTKIICDNYYKEQNLRRIDQKNDLDD